MKLNEKAGEILARYIYAVKRELSSTSRDDISAELESYILDLLEERFPNIDTITVEQLQSVLSEMGAPRKVAAQYAPNRYLIGPMLYPTFLLVLKILVLVVIGGITISFIVNAFLGELAGVGLVIFEYIGSLFSGVLSAAGAVVAVFAIIERVSEGKALDEIAELDEFKLNELPELPLEEQKFSRAGTIFEIVMGSIGITFFAYILSNGGRLPFYASPMQEMQLVKFITDGFLRAAPLIIFVAVLDIIRNSLLLKQSYHSSVTNWWKICTQGVNLGILILLLSSRPLVTLTSPVITAIAPEVDFTQLDSLVNLALTIALSLGLLGTIVEIIKMIIAELRNPAH